MRSAWATWDPVKRKKGRHTHRTGKSEASTGEARESNTLLGCGVSLGSDRNVWSWGKRGRLHYTLRPVLNMPSPIIDCNS